MNTHAPCDKVVSALLGHLRQDDFEVIPAGDGCLVVTPFSLPDRAALEFLVEPHDSGYLLSDAGSTLAELFVNGIEIEGNPALVHEVQEIAELHDVKFGASTLSVAVGEAALGAATQNLIAAIQATSYLIYKRRHTSKRGFADEVEEFIIAKRVAYQSSYEVRGLASTHHIPLYVNSSRNLFIEPLAAHTVSSARAKAKQIGYVWNDLKAGKVLHHSVVILDDKGERWEKVWSDPEAMSPLRTYTEHVIRWSTGQPRLAQLLEEL